MDHADRPVVVRVLHEIPADDVVAVGHALALLRTGREEHTRVLHAPEREHIAPGVHVEGRPSERPAHDGLRASPCLIQTNVGHIGVGDHAHVIGALEHRAVHGTEACRRTELVIALIDVRGHRQQTLCRSGSRGRRRPTRIRRSRASDRRAGTTGRDPHTSEATRYQGCSLAPRSPAASADGTTPPSVPVVPPSARIRIRRKSHVSMPVMRPSERACVASSRSRPPLSSSRIDRPEPRSPVRSSCPRPRAGDADVGFERRAFSERPAVDQHGRQSATAF